MSKCLAILFVAVGWFAAGIPGVVAQDNPKTPDASKPDPDLQGAWKLKLVYDKLDETGKSYIAVTSKYVITIKGSEMTAEWEEKGKPETAKYTLDLDQTKKPKVYTQTKAGDKKAKPTSGIYSVEKGILRMCYQADGKPPEGFTIKRDDGKNRVMDEFERVKP